MSEPQPVYVDALGATHCATCRSIIRNAKAEAMVLLRLHDVELIAKWLAATPTESTRHELFAWLEATPLYTLQRLEQAISQPATL